jgi:hypothetical protein
MHRADTESAAFLASSAVNFFLLSAISLLMARQRPKIYADVGPLALVDTSYASRHVARMKTRFIGEA